MIRTTFTLTAVLLILAGCQQPKIDIAEMMKPPPRPAELDQLNAFVGTWEGTWELNMQGADKPVTGKGVDTFAWDADKWVLAQRGEGTMGDFRGWGAWSPWEKKDPALKRTFSGAATGKGAVYAWEGNRNVGSGRMEITDTTEPTRVVIKLDFLTPFEGHNTAEFTLEPQGDSTHVVWVMHGPAAYISKLMGVFMDMDRMIGKDFEAGLAGMKAIAENKAS